MLALSSLLPAHLAVPEHLRLSLFFVFVYQKFKQKSNGHGNCCYPASSRAAGPFSSHPKNSIFSAVFSSWTCFHTFLPTTTTTTHNSTKCFFHALQTHRHTMAPYRTVWGVEAHRDLLIAVMTNISLAANEWSKVSVELSAKGYSYTQQAALCDFSFLPVPSHGFQTEPQFQSTR